jgi:hypothetical protein
VGGAAGTEDDVVEKLRTVEKLPSVPSVFQPATFQ